MKIAIAYDWLNQKSGGGEDTLFEILSIYPDADLFCLIYNKAKFASKIGERQVVTSRLQHFPSFMKKRPYLLLPFIKKSVDKLNFEGYDLVISVSSAWVKNIKTPEHTVHICYCFSPARMIWDSWPQYLTTQKLGPFKVGPISKFFITKSVSKIRLWDYYSTKGVDNFIAISKYIQMRIKKYYHRDSDIVYPPVDLSWFKNTSITNKKDDYFIIVSVLSRYKNIELAIKVFNKNKRKLVIVGDGPDRSRLQSLTSSDANITFLGRVSNKNKAELLSKAKAFVFCSVEDFGIAPIEALAAGTPVIGPDKGGLKETIAQNKTGILYKELLTKDLESAIKRFDKISFSKQDLIKASKKYSNENFKRCFAKAITKLLEEKNE